MTKLFLAIALAFLLVDGAIAEATAKAWRATARGFVANFPPPAYPASSVGRRRRRSRIGCRPCAGGTSGRASRRSNDQPTAPLHTHLERTHCPANISERHRGQGAESMTASRAAGGWGSIPTARRRAILTPSAYERGSRRAVPERHGRDGLPRLASEFYVRWLMPFRYSEQI